jgi:hypothetical protein
MEGWVPGLRRLHHLVVWQRDAIARSDHDDELMPNQVLHDGREKISPNTPTHKPVSPNQFHLSGDGVALQDGDVVNRVRRRRRARSANRLGW